MIDRTLSRAQFDKLHKPDKIRYPLKYYSQFKEDKEFVGIMQQSEQSDQLDGTFLEIGAIDGVQYSNTKMLEDHFGWKGFLIEATPHMCEKLKVSDRKRSIKICSAICHRGEVEYSIHSTSNAINGLRNYSYENRGHKPKIKEVIKLKCHQISELLIFYNVTKIDLFSLDVEGSEKEVMETFDFSVPVHYWIIETGKKPADHEKNLWVRDKLISNGYTKLDTFGKFSSKEINDYWVKDDYK